MVISIKSVPRTIMPRLPKSKQKRIGDILSLEKAGPIYNALSVKNTAEIR
jgi:hypothetical protein